ncbi:DNA repair protein RadA [Crocinitomix catalasitica]|uniref:DNA repair protein RadA n=1 Tax=Crocinitomix catalasitica TaxID=184607 RepID=UPI000484DC52|nr:DNA repair protein RadA [Crocinitomix catalasitica]
MSKTKTSFFCQNCGTESPKWVGKCSSCNEWNTYIEEIIQKAPKSATPFSSSSSQRAAKPHKLNDIERLEERRIMLKDEEMNRVLGGGIVPGSLILFGGEPGIGKSTLLLQLSVSEVDKTILYISGEESEQQVSMRADRIGSKNENCYVLTETSIENIFIQLEAVKPDLLVIDSIQTVHTSMIDSSPGSVSQVKACTAEFLKYAKESGTPVFLIGHITKEGSLAGPKVLEHMVDAVLVFEGDRNHVYRLVRSVKNRFGSTNELGIYEMVSAGLRQVDNPSEILITNNDEQLSGISIASTIEGVRPMLIEVQALVSTAAYGTPQRSTTGFDLRRLNMLLAVLEKRCGFNLGAKDVFLNIAGGIKVNDPALDLAVVCAIMSSNANIPITNGIAFSAELSLSGEIRPVSRIDQRISEAEKMGFESIIISKYNKGVKQDNYNIKVHQVGKIEDAIRIIFG